MHTTLNKIRAHHPCEDGWVKLLSRLGKTKADDEPVSFLTILESNGLDHALWCLRSTPEYDRDSRLFAVWCARKVQHLMKDQRSINSIDVAERFASSEATQDELDAACAAAGDAAWDAACAAAWYAAGAAAGAAARAAAQDAQCEMFIKMCHGEAPWQAKGE